MYRAFFVLSFDMKYGTHLAVVMSNQRFLKIESFRFPTFVPKKIEYIRFLN